MESTEWKEVMAYGQQYASKNHRVVSQMSQDLQDMLYQSIQTQKRKSEKKEDFVRSKQYQQLTSMIFGTEFRP